MSWIFAQLRNALTKCNTNVFRVISKVDEHLELIQCQIYACIATTSNDDGNAMFAEYVSLLSIILFTSYLVALTAFTDRCTMAFRLTSFHLSLLYTSNTHIFIILLTSFDWGLFKIKT